MNFKEKIKTLIAKDEIQTVELKFPKYSNLSYEGVGIEPGGNSERSAIEISKENFLLEDDYFEIILTGNVVSSKNIQLILPYSSIEALSIREEKIVRIYFIDNFLTDSTHEVIRELKRGDNQYGAQTIISLLYYLLNPAFSDWEGLKKVIIKNNESEIELTENQWEFIETDDWYDSNNNLKFLQFTYTANGQEIEKTITNSNILSFAVNKEKDEVIVNIIN